MSKPAAAAGGSREGMGGLVVVLCTAAAVVDGVMGTAVVDEVAKPASDAGVVASSCFAANFRCFFSGTGASAAWVECWVLASLPGHRELCGTL